MTDSSAGTEEKTPEYIRVAECLYRSSSSGRYYALFKRSGKQIRKSLRTQDRKLAERRLKEIKRNLGFLDPSSESRQILFEELGAQWMELHNSRLKQSSADRNERCLKQLLRFFKGARVVDIRRIDCQTWELKRGKKLKSSSYNKEWKS